MIVMDEEKYNVNVVSAVSVDFPGKFFLPNPIKR